MIRSLWIPRNGNQFRNLPKEVNERNIVKSLTETFPGTMTLETQRVNWLWQSMSFEAVRSRIRAVDPRRPV